MALIEAGFIIFMLKCAFTEDFLRCCFINSAFLSTTGLVQNVAVGKKLQ